MKRLLLSIVVLCLGWAAYAQDDQVLMTINGKPVMASEFMYIYQKNNQDNAIEKKSMDEYLDMFINFKLKVFEAESEGLDTTEAFRKELKGYRAQAIPKYMKDDQALDSMVMLSYNRMAWNRRAAHIAVECPQNASDSVKDAAWERINLLRQRVTTGLPQTVGKGKKAKVVYQKEDFKTVAKAESSDPSAAENSGELGWIIPFRYVYSFEDAVYRTPVGEVSEIFTSPYGYHIALVEETRPLEEAHAAHIMKMVPGGDSIVDAKAKAAIDSIYNLLLAGADFNELASKLSEDKGSAMRGGDLGWFGRGMMVKPFEDAVFGLKEHEISKPFKSRFGWHIARLDGLRGMQPIDSVRAQITKNVQRDERSKEIDKAFIRKVRAEYQLSDTMSDENVRLYADEHLEEKYDDLKHLVQEYHDGILLFDISMKNVWDKAAKDTKGLSRYFNTHKGEYVWTAPRYKGYVIYAANATVAKQTKNIIMTANPDSIGSYIDHRINTDSVRLVKVEHGLWQQGQNKAVDKFQFKVKDVDYTPLKDLSVVQFVGKKIKAPQEYTDERSKVTSAYQDELEKAWIEQLRAKYNVVVNKDVFERIRANK